MTGTDLASLPATERRTLSAIRALRIVAWALVAGWLLLAVAIIALRYFVLPNVGAYKDDVAALMSRAVGAKVTIGAIGAHWHGLHPWLELGDVRIHDAGGAVALSLPAIDASVGWRSLVAGELRFHSLAFESPELKIRRDREGRIFVAGMEVAGPAPADGGLADWVLRQGEVVVRNGRVEWLDEKRGAPPLALASVGIRIRNHLSDHHVAIAATPPPELASKLDLRARLEGDSFEALQAWTGRFFAEVDFVDLAAWKAWFDYPIQVDAGRGSLRAWLDFAGGRLTEAVADVGLADVGTRLAPDLPRLDLASLSGRFGAREVRKGSGFFAFVGRGQPGWEVFGEKLAFGLRGEPELKPTDFRLRWQPRSEGREGSGEFRADAIELEPLAALVERLPFPGNVRRALLESEPKGALREVTFTWDGPAEEPNRYSARGRFDGLGLRPRAGLPGFSGLAGAFGINEAGGSVTVDARPAGFEYPGVLAGGPLAFDALAGRVTWTRTGAGLELRFDNVSLASPDIAATAQGSWREGPGGGVDLTLRGTRVAAASAWRYVPNLSPAALEWLSTAVTGGTATDIRMRLKGSLADFPFDDPKTGAFELALKVADATIEIGNGWPRFERVAGEVAFEGRRMTIAAAKGTTLGMPVSPVKGRIPDLYAPITLLVIEGQAEGPTDAFLRYVEASPVNDAIGRLTAGMRAEGRGRLSLKLELPIEELAKTSVAGSFQFAGNTLRAPDGDAPVTQLSGTLSFTEQGVSARALTGQLLGGPFTASAATREGVVQVTVQGTARVAELADFLDAPRAIAGRLQGALPYTATARLRGRLADVMVESNLQGVASDLPPPFAKAAQDVWPSRVERTIVAGTVPAQRRDNVTAQIGAALAAAAQFRPEGERLVLDRAALSVGAAATPPLPREPGIALAVSLADFDYDRFAAAFPADLQPGGGLAFESATLKVGLLTAGGKRFHDVDVKARISGDTVQMTVAAREASGEATYRAGGAGALTARLKHLVYPEPAPGGAPLERPKELPALDIVAESFTLDEHRLGRLELVALSEGGDWRIKRAALIAPEGVAKLEGVARPALGGAPARTDLSFTIDVNDVGAYLERIGMPGVIARGDASLTGRAAWNGPVYDIDYPTLTGKLTLRAENGQFLKVKPGIGRLLGVLSLQSIGRRLSLDFRDVFSEGFAFDVVSGSAAITKGIASTTDLAMVGPAANVSITGTANLAKETQDLRVRIVPSIGDSAAVAAGIALVNPVIGLGALLAQRVLKDPIGQMLAYEYQVTGSWDDPRVERVRAPQPLVETPIPREAGVPGAAN
ncbi:MAG: YhdP family protein [Burkholderiales bacterium]|nr:YhdP family protein [Burkholderiales bacterium]